MSMSGVQRMWNNQPLVTAANDSITIKYQFVPTSSPLYAA